MRLKIGDVVSGGTIRTRAMVIQKKTGRPVQFELLPDARSSLLAWLQRRGGTVEDLFFQAGLIATVISAPDSMRGLSMSG